MNKEALELECDILIPAALENQINSLQRLLTLKDEALNDLQQRSGMTAAKPQPQTETPAPAMQVPPMAPAKPAPPKPAPAQPPTPSAEQPADLFANPTLLGAAAGAALLLLSVVWLIIRRRRNEDEGEVAEAVVDEAAAPEGETQTDQQVDRMDAPAVAELGDAEQMSQVAEEVAQGVEQDIPQAASDLDVLHTPEGDIDPIVEADVYLAYRRYQQAEGLIQGALGKQPGRQDLQAKLLEIHYASKNADAFQSVAETLFENMGRNADSEIWQRVLPMGRELCPDSALFGDSHGAPEGDGGSLFEETAGDTLMGGDQGLGGESFAASTSTEEHMDLNLGGEERIESASAGVHDEKMELDLNIGGDLRAAQDDALGAASFNEPESPVAESADSMNAALGRELTSTSSAAEETGAGEAKEEEEKGSGESWEIEPAMSDFGNIDFGLDDADLLAGTDVVGTKLDLARAYIDMGDNDSARDILSEVIAEGNDQQKQEAKGLVEKIA